MKRFSDRPRFDIAPQKFDLPFAYCGVDFKISTYSCKNKLRYCNKLTQRRKLTYSVISLCNLPAKGKQNIIKRFCKHSVT